MAVLGRTVSLTSPPVTREVVTLAQTQGPLQITATRSFPSTYPWTTSTGVVARNWS